MQLNVVLIFSFVLLFLIYFLLPELSQNQFFIVFFKMGNSLQLPNTKTSIDQPIIPTIVQYLKKITTLQRRSPIKKLSTFVMKTPRRQQNQQPQPITSTITTTNNSPAWKLRKCECFCYESIKINFIHLIIYYTHFTYTNTDTQ